MGQIIGEGITFDDVLLYMETAAYTLSPGFKS